MTDYIKKLEFKETPKEITYIEDKPLELNEDFVFFHNKSIYRINFMSMIIIIVTL